jgi:hypothetical protein
MHHGAVARGEHLGRFWESLTCVPMSDEAKPDAATAPTVEEEDKEESEGDDDVDAAGGAGAATAGGAAGAAKKKKKKNKKKKKAGAGAGDAGAAGAGAGAAVAGGGGSASAADGGAAPCAAAGECGVLGHGTRVGGCGESGRLLLLSVPHHNPQPPPPALRPAPCAAACYPRIGVGAVWLPCMCAVRVCSAGGVFEGRVPPHRGVTGFTNSYVKSGQSDPPSIPVSGGLFVRCLLLTLALPAWVWSCGSRHPPARCRAPHTVRMSPDFGAAPVCVYHVCSKGSELCVRGASRVAGARACWGRGPCELWLEKACLSVCLLSCHRWCAGRQAVSPKGFPGG